MEENIHQFLWKIYINSCGEADGYVKADFDRQPDTDDAREERDERRTGCEDRKQP